MSIFSIIKLQHKPSVNLNGVIITKKLIILFFFVLNFSLLPQSNIFLRIGIEEGLPPGNVNDIVQDSLGFVWLGTESGLCRFDGYNFITYKNVSTDSTSLSHNNIFSLLLDKNGIIWVGTLGGGLNKFDSKSGKFKRFLSDDKSITSLSSNTIYSVIRDSKSILWISTLGGGLNRFNPKTEIFKNYSHDPKDASSISSNMVSSIFEESNGKLWIGTFDAGLNFFDRVKEKFGVLKHSSENEFSINHDQIMDVIKSSDGNLLVATFGGGINILNPNNNSFTNYKNSKDFIYNTEHKNIRKLYDDGESIWIASYNGLYQFEKKQQQMNKFLSDEDNLYSINNNKIREIFRDENGLIWVGTINGVNQYETDRIKFDFHSFQSPREEIMGHSIKFPLEFLGSQIKWPILKGTQNSKRSIRYFGQPNISGIFKNKYSVNYYEDENKTLWIGDYDGLKYFDTKTGKFNYIEVFSDERSQRSKNYIKCFYIDSDKVLWAGKLNGGLTSFDQKTNTSELFVHSESDENSISDSRVHKIYEDSFGDLWIGTYGGLNKFDKKEKKFIRYLYEPNTPSRISNNRIYSIFESENNDLWIGTYQGLNKYNRANDNFEQIIIKDEFSDKTIFGILEDGENNLWIRTNKGISQFNPKSGVIKNYSKDDGLNELSGNNSISHESIDGEMFFSGLKGFDSFYPSNILENKNPPKLVFTELKVLDKSIAVGDKNYLPESLNSIDELQLSYKDKIFSIEFAALHFASPKKNQYAYMLEGFIDQWTFVNSDHRVASFTNLSAGEYVLHVKASNNNGIWNQIGRSLKISVTPPYWETWWFRIVAFIVFVLLIFAWYELRLTKLVEVERTRARIARNLHDDVGGTLASIQYFVNAVKKSSNETQKTKFLDLIMASSNDAQEKVRDIIWTVNPKEDGLTRFLVKFNRHASDLFDSHNIKYKIKFPKIEDEKTIKMQQRQHIWLICKETITNIIRHSNCKNVDVKFELNGNILTYIIKDDGIGFNKNKITPGDGLTNIAFRSNKLNAKHSIETSKGRGLKFKISFEI